MFSRLMHERVKRFYIYVCLLLYLFQYIVICLIVHLIQLLIRYIKSENSEIRKLIYKNKKYESDIVLSEEKTSVGIDNINDAKELFKKLNYQGVVDVNYNTCIYSNLKDELAFQDVEGLGLLLEYENAKDFYLASANEILTEKSMMMMIIKNYGIDVTEDYDVKKAYELIKKRYK